MVSILAVPMMIAALTPADIHVGSGQSIQQAINLAADGDRVLVAAGTYFESIDFAGKAIEVIGVSGAKNTTIDAANLEQPVVKFHNAEGPESRLQGFTIRGGFTTTYLGGGISATHWPNGDARPTIEDCIIRNNASGWGGGVTGSPDLTRCAIVQNTSILGGEGGGVIGAAHLRYCLIADNRADNGGGLSGGVAEDCVIVDNTVENGGRGGGVYGTTLVRCILKGNSAYAEFGVTSKGGGAFASSLDRCTVVGNTALASAQGGGVHSCTVTNSILRDNVPDQAYSSTVSYSNVSGGAAGLGNMDQDPMFVEAAVEDWHLRSGSPCIDAGDPAVLDPDQTVADMGAHFFETLYTATNAQDTKWFDPGWPQVSLLVGGRQDIRINADSSHSGDLYFLVGSASGTSPGLSVGGIHVPLNVDSYLLVTLTSPLTSPAGPGLGFLNGMGLADLTFQLPAGMSATLAGLTLHHAAVVLELIGPVPKFATSPLSVELVP